MMLIPVSMANDPSAHPVMAVLDTAGPPTAIHAFAFESRSRRESQPRLIGIIPTIIANDPSAHLVMAVLDTAIHALLFDNRRHHESESRLLGIR
jgi:hypothetical protein